MAHRSTLIDPDKDSLNIYPKFDEFVHMDHDRRGHLSAQTPTILYITI